MSSIITTLLGLSGYPLIGVICGLIVLEELGIPMPMAPGDVLLVLAGVSIATGRVNPFVVVIAAYLSALLGALGGREIFEHIGRGALPRIARVLHAGGRVDDLTAKLRHGGSASVFLGRITPGLRIVTTYLSGLVAMPRRTFLIGLAPGIAVYQAVFIGLGAWLGLGVLTSSKPIELFLVLVTIVGLALIGRALIKHMRGRARRSERRTPAATVTSTSSTPA